MNTHRPPIEYTVFENQRMQTTFAEQLRRRGPGRPRLLQSFPVDDFCYVYHLRDYEVFPYPYCVGRWSPEEKDRARREKTRALARVAEVYRKLYPDEPNDGPTYQLPGCEGADEKGPRLLLWFAPSDFVISIFPGNPDRGLALDCAIVERMLARPPRPGQSLVSRAHLRRAIIVPSTEFGKYHRLPANVLADCDRYDLAICRLRREIQELYRLQDSA